MTRHWPRLTSTGTMLPAPFFEGIFYMVDNGWGTGPAAVAGRPKWPLTPSSSRRNQVPGPNTTRLLHTHPFTECSLHFQLGYAAGCLLSHTQSKPPPLGRDVPSTLGDNKLMSRCESGQHQSGEPVCLTHERATYFRWRKAKSSSLDRIGHLGKQGPARPCAAAAQFIDDAPCIDTYTYACLCAGELRLLDRLHCRTRGRLPRGGPPHAAQRSQHPG